MRETWRELDRAIPPGSDRYAHYPGGEREYWMRFTRSTLEKASRGEVPEPFVGKVLDRLAEAFRALSVWRIYPDVIPALEGLQAAGVRMGVVSNWDSNLALSCSQPMKSAARRVRTWRFLPFSQFAVNI